MTLTIRPDLQSLIASLIPSGWQFERLVCDYPAYFSDRQPDWFAYISDGDVIANGHGTSPEAAIESAGEKALAGETQLMRPIPLDQPAKMDLDEILGLRPKINIGKRL